MAQGEESPPWTSPFAETQSPHKTQTPPLSCQHLCSWTFCSPQYKARVAIPGKHNIWCYTGGVTAENIPALDFGASAGMAERSSINVKETIKYENGI